MITLVHNGCLIWLSSYTYVITYTGNPPPPKWENGILSWGFAICLSRCVIWVGWCLYFSLKCMHCVHSQLKYMHHLILGNILLCICMGGGSAVYVRQKERFFETQWITPSRSNISKKSSSYLVYFSLYNLTDEEACHKNLYFIIPCNICCQSVISV